MAEGIRIDKWLWTMRIFKTRSDAADACRNNKVLVNDAYIKPSRDVKPGDLVKVKKNLITYTFRIFEIIGNRQGAKNISQYMENLTPQSELDKLMPPRETIFIQRDRGTGRPTKKERREIDDLMGDLSYMEFLDEED